MTHREIGGDLPSAAASSAMPDRMNLAATAFERTRMPMVVADARQADHPIVLANRAFLKLTGYTAQEVLGRNCRLLQGPATSAAALAEIRAGLKAETEVNVELLNYRKNGETFWNRLHLSPIHDEAGRLIYHFGSQIDVTRYRNVKSLEASQHRLLMEVDHRAKNVLALVDSIVRLTPADDPHRYAAGVQHRVQALSRAHGLLAKNNWRAVSMNELLRAQLDPFGMEQISLEGPPLTVSSVAVQPLSLVAHELALNASEHGALSVREGRLAVEWDSESVNDVAIQWTESGGPHVTEPGKRGFGFTMADAIVRRQLLGVLDRRWLSTGLVAIIKVPRQAII